MKNSIIEKTTQVATEMGGAAVGAVKSVIRAAKSALGSKTTKRRKRPAASKAKRVRAKVAKSRVSSRRNAKARA